MKKIYYLLLMVLPLLTMTSCSDDDSSETAAEVKVVVKENGALQKGVIVYMFDEEKGINSNFFRPLFADKQVVTEDDGVAAFELREVYDLDAVEDQATLYFAVFNENESVKGKTVVTVRKGEVKTTEISY